MTIEKIVELVALIVGGASIVSASLYAALALIAPKTESDADDRALGFLDKVVKGLTWLKSLVDAVALNFGKSQAK